MTDASFGRYQLIREIGRGGMATVFLARDPQLDADVAVKVLPRDFAHDAGFRTRFEREARAIAALREHPAIVPIYDFGTQDGQPYLVMQYMRGGSLSDRLRDGPLSPATAARIIERIAGALQVAHDKGIVHRDLKPGNILFDQFDQAYLADFGIARLAEQTTTLTQGIIGTPAYMSPEQVDTAQTVDYRTDIYALGIILYEMLTGDTPFQADTPVKMMMAHVLQPTPRVRDANEAITPAVESVVARALAKEKTGRHASAAALSADLTAALTQVGRSPAAVADSATIIVPPADPASTADPGQPPPPLRAKTPTPAPRRLPRWPMAILALIVVSAVTVWGLAWRDRLPRAQRDTETPTPALTASATAVDSAAADEVAVGDPPPTPTVTPTATSAPTDTPEASTALDDLSQAFAGAYAGTTVVLDSMLFESNARALEQVLDAFAAETGIDIRFAADPQFTDRWRAADLGATAPDIAVVNLPGPLSNFDPDILRDVTSLFPPGYIETRYAPDLLNLATVEGPSEPFVAGIWLGVYPGGVVWYPSDAWAAAGYSVPTTWTELTALSDRMIADGRTPWCIGIESGAATGWVITNWMEALVLRVAGPVAYDAWAAGDLPFTSAEIADVMEHMVAIWTNDRAVFGGREAIATTGFLDAAAPLFNEPPDCWMHFQSGFITSSFPVETRFGSDFGVFALPSIEPAFGRPMIISGDLVVPLADRPEIRAVLAHLASLETTEAWIDAADSFAARRDYPLSGYADPIAREVAAILSDATILRLDASDELMPAAVGAGAFWTEMTAWIEGEQSLDAALRAIDAAWPR